MARQAKIERKTRETQVSLELQLDGNGKADIETGVGFFDHMLEILAVHAMFDLKVKASGDLQVDDHHTVEDIGICLGQALQQAVGDKKGIKRYGTAYVPLDEALARCVVDFCGRSYLVFANRLDGRQAGNFHGELVEEFLHALASNAMLTLHVDILRGRNAHHEIEVVFKALGQSFRAALSQDSGRPGVPSSKGVL